MRYLVKVNKETKLDKIFPSITSFPNITEIIYDYYTDDDKIYINISSYGKVDNIEKLMEIIGMSIPSSKTINVIITDVSRLFRKISGNYYIVPISERRRSSISF